jgi:hypothetical protein
VNRIRQFAAVLGSFRHLPHGQRRGFSKIGAKQELGENLYVPNESRYHKLIPLDKKVLQYLPWYLSGDGRDGLPQRYAASFALIMADVKKSEETKRDGYQM